ncbi:MAG: hypothetical protein K8R37_04230 [Bacteroidales bacterium]|nr:hypothetical protein [Bacteroidales bacterium]
MNKQIFGLITSAFIVIHCFDLSGQTVDSLKIKFELDNFEYLQGDTVKLLITNTSNDTLFIYNPFFTSNCIILKKRTENAWEQLNIQGFSGGIFIFNKRPFLTGETIVFNWNQSVNIFGPPFKREIASKGKYRFEFLFSQCLNCPEQDTVPVRFLNSIYQDFFVTYSKKFEIK